MEKLEGAFHQTERVLRDELSLTRKNQDEASKKYPTRVLLDIQTPPPLRSHFGGRENYRAWAVVCRMERFEGQTSSRIGARFLRDATGDAQASG